MTGIGQWLLRLTLLFRRPQMSTSTSRSLCGVFLVGLLISGSYVLGQDCENKCKPINWVVFVNGNCRYYSKITCLYHSPGGTEYKTIWALTPFGNTCQEKSPKVTGAEFNCECSEACPKPYPYPEEAKAGNIDSCAYSKDVTQHECSK